MIPHALNKKYICKVKMSQYPSNVTMIDELPTLDDMESYHSQTYDQEMADRTLYNDQAKSKIRNTHMPPPESGMMAGYDYPTNGFSRENYHSMNHSQDMYSSMQQSQQPMQQSLMDMTSYPQETTSNVTCVEIAEHVKNCPVCKRLYNPDNTLYIIVIVILAIVCILLIKRILDV